MEFGITLTPHIRDYEYVKLAEQLGYSQAGFYDSQMIYSDVYATMALCAKETSRIKLGTGVAVPTTRIAPVIAHSIATIAELAPGRVELGVGNGNVTKLNANKLITGKDEKRNSRHPSALTWRGGGFRNGGKN